MYKILIFLITFTFGQLQLNDDFNYWDSDNWEGNEWCFNINNGNWIPNIDDGIAQMVSTNTCWHQIRTLFSVQNGRNITLTFIPFLQSGSSNWDGAYFALSSNWIQYGNTDAVGVLFKEGNIIAWSQSNGEIETIGNYLSGDTITITLAWNHNGSLTILSNDFIHTLESTYLNFDNAKLVIANKDSQDGFFLDQIQINVKTFTFSPMSLDFGEVRLGESADLDVEFCNTGEDDLIVDITPSEQLSVSLSGFVIYGGNCVNNTATYTPTEEGEFTGSLNIQSNDAGDPDFDMEVTGIGIAEPIINVTPDFLHFDVVVLEDTLATQTLTITNDGFADLTWEIMAGEDVYGNGSDGEHYIPSGEPFYIDEVRTAVIGDNFSGSSVITVSNTEGFNSGDEVLIISMQHPNENLDDNVTGTYETHYIENVDGNTLYFVTSLSNDYLTSNGAIHQAIRVPNYSNLIVDGTLTCNAWNGATGGVVFFRTTGTTTINGSIDANGKGYNGGDGGPLCGTSTCDLPNIDCGYGYQGESINGIGVKGNLSANIGGGGAGANIENNCIPVSGGGGGYGNIGGEGYGVNNNPNSSGGSIYGSSILDKLFLGSGGGGGSQDKNDGTSGDSGSNGGGIITLFSNNIIFESSSLINSSGLDVAPDDQDTGNGVGGGGSGGTIIINLETYTDYGSTIQAIGGLGGVDDPPGGYPGNVGGDGSNGRIRINLLDILEPLFTEPEAHIFMVPSYTSWISIEPENGTVEAIIGESVSINITANASSYEYGDYEGSIQITSNDPENPVVELPVTMSVLYPVAEASVDELYFEESFNSIVYSDFEITNSGNYPLTVNASLSHPYLSVEQDSLSIEPDSAAGFRVYFNSTLEEIEFSDNLILTYNDPFNSSDTVIITGKVVPDVRPIITSIDDVPNDQGGMLTIEFTRSVYDASSLRNPELYTIEMNIGEGWIASNSLVAYGDERYSSYINTPIDSSATTDGVIDFRVIAGMEEGNFASDVVTGYSIDNIHPATPELTSAEHEDMDVSINWQYELEEDFAYHRITSLNSTDNTISNEHSFTLDGHDEHWVNSVDYNSNYSDNTESIISISLHAGANLKSFNVLPEDNSITNVMASIEGVATGVIGEGVAANYMEGNGWMGSLSAIDLSSGYWIMVSEDDVLLLMGEPTSRELAYTLHEGANLISYPFRYETVLEEALPEGIGCDISGIIGEGVAATCMNGNWMGSLSHLEGSYGYWFKTSSDISLTFNGCDEQECASLSRQQSQTIITNPEGYEFVQSTEQAFYFLESIENIEMGDWILSYNDDVVIGAREWQGSIIDIPAMGNDGSDYTKGYIETGSVPSFKILRGDELINLEGDIPAFENNQLYMVSSLTEAVVLPESFSLDRAYPNPFNPTTTLSFAIPVDSEVFLSVYNLQGREVSTLIDANMDAGYHSIVWNADSYSSGVYFVKMVASEYVNTQKLMLIK